MVNTEKIVRGARLIRPVLKRYRLRMSWIVILGLLAGLFGGLGVSVVIPLFAILTNHEELSANFISDLIRNVLAFFGIPINAVFLILLIIILFFLKALVQFLAKYVNDKTTAAYEEEVRTKLFDKTIKTSWPSLLKYKGGYLERVLLHDVAHGAAVINMTGEISVMLTGFLVYAAIAFGISWIITVSTILFGVVIFFVLKPTLYKVRMIIKEMANDEKSVNHQISESVSGAKIIKSYAVEGNVIAQSIQYFQKLRISRVKLSFIRNLLGQFAEPAGIIFIGMLFLLTYQSPGFNIASFVVAVYLIQKMFNSIQITQNHLNSLNELIPYLKITHDYYKNAIDNSEVSGGEKEFSFKEKLEFQDILFSYKKGSAHVINGVDFTIEKNTSVGLIGPSGVGKTTLADLVMRLFKPEKGNIKLDGINAEEIKLPDWRKNIVYVSQDVFLLNDSVENNIRFFDSSISKEKIMEAAKSANIHHTIENLESGYDTIVGERGLRLSAGQRQRIALARALVRNPQILILDEATSALDNESEQAIQKSIRELKGKTTIITIAHRLDTIMDSDELLVLDGGKIIEQGKPEKLLEEKDSHFYKIYNIRNEK